jgi:hypothetical protein
MPCCDREQSAFIGHEKISAAGCEWRIFSADMKQHLPRGFPKVSQRASTE